MMHSVHIYLYTYNCTVHDSNSFQSEFNKMIDRNFISIKARFGCG